MKMDKSFNNISNELNIEAYVYTRVCDMITDQCKDVVRNLKRRPTFFESLKTSQTLSNIKDIVKFDDAKINIGGGYDSTTGIFTVPWNGIYIFSCTIMGNAGGAVHFQLNKNDQLYTAGFVAKSNYGAQTVNSFAEFRTGDKVYVKHRSSASESVRESHFSTFSGYLLSK
ncbi:C1QL [Mytilus coruscus]|uniref:C1QL n=1 Tax=Mytilus coruscus TaxID=42192 RepID=A0A6J8EW04_MYTCO|nr:C1QL [Mytilus coruscus]